jgi:catechol 2,3-dioxygenase-like lactoylglutathione lyase family enzyme
MNMKLEVIVLPVSDVDRAKRFYEKAGFRMDADYVGSEEFRVVQLTPPGSECSIIIGKGITSAAPGTSRRRAPSLSAAAWRWVRCSTMQAEFSTMPGPPGG